MVNAVIVNSTEINTRNDSVLSPVQELMQTVSDKFGAESVQQFKSYLDLNASNAYKVTHNANSADCWINAAERDLLVHNKDRMAQLLKQLVDEGHLTKDMLSAKDPYPDNGDLSSGQSLGSRSGVSLAFDLACGRKFNATYSANDFQVEAFESWARGSATVAVYNGKSDVENRNGKSSIDRLLASGADANGIRCSLRWAQGQNSQHMYHVVTIDSIGTNSKGEKVVYFYQSVSIPGINGPRREWTGKDGLESMSLEDFKSALRVAWVPENPAGRLGINRLVDPAYFAQGQTKRDLPGIEEQFKSANYENVYETVTVEYLRYRDHLEREEAQKKRRLEQQIAAK